MSMLMINESKALTCLSPGSAGIDGWLGLDGWLGVHHRRSRLCRWLGVHGWPLSVHHRVLRLNGWLGVRRWLGRAAHGGLLGGGVEVDAVHVAGPVAVLGHRVVLQTGGATDTVAHLPESAKPSPH